MKRSESPSPSAHARKTPSGSRGKKWLLRAAIFMAVYTLVGFFAVPALIKWQLKKQVPAATHRATAVRQVKFNPYALSLTLNGVALTETNGEAFASWEQFYVNFQLSSVFRRAWTFAEIRLAEPRFSAVLLKDGRFNFANLTEKTNAAPPKPTNEVEAASIPRVIVFALTITNGHVAFSDRTLAAPFRTVYEPINLSIQNFTTKPDRNSPYSFEASGDGGRSIAWRGTISANPAASAGILRITGIDLPRHNPYLASRTTAQLTGGKVDVAGDYQFGAGTNGVDLVVSNLTMSITGLEIKDSQTNETVFALPQYALRGGRIDLRERRAHVESIEINEPSALIRRQADGSLNLAALLINTPAETNNTTNVVVAAETNAAPPWIFSLANLQLARGKVAVEDLTVPEGFRTQLSPITLRIEHFSTATDSNAQVGAEIVTEAGEKIELNTAACLAPLRAEGLVQLTGIDLQKYSPYLKAAFAGKLKKGKLDLALPFAHSATAATNHQVILSNGMVRLSDLQVDSPDAQETWISVPSLVVDGVGVNLLEQTAEVQTVGSTNVQLHLRREKDGGINLLSLLVQNSKTNSAGSAEATAGTGTNEQSAATNTAPVWRAAVNEVAFEGWKIKFEDDTLPKRATVNVDDLSLKLRGIQFPSNAPIETTFSARINEAGKINTRGMVHPYTAGVDTAIDVAGFSLRDFQPWLSPHLNLQLASGLLSTTGQFTLAPTNIPGPRIRFAGGLSLTNLVTKEQDKELARWNELEITGAKIDLEPTAVDIERIRLDGLKTALIVGQDKTLNFNRVLPAKPTNSVATAKTSEPVNTPEVVSTNAAPPIRIAEIKIENGSFDFRDESIEPHAAFNLEQFGGHVRGLSSAAGATAELDVSGRVDASAPFGVRGTINPLSKDLLLDIVFTNQNLQLTPFTPYMEKYAGYPLNKGRLSLDLGYAIKEGQLKAHNVVRIDQLTLGQKNNSPDATKAPVKLGVALLKDASGRIELDVPLDGRLNDPEFRVGPLVVKVVMNLIAKAAASPFKLLGGLVGGGEELSFVDFEPGLAVLRPGETNKIEKLAKALQQRPALNLEIEGSVDPALDRDAIARVHVRRDAKQVKLEELKAIEEAADENQPMDIEADYDRLLRVLADKAFGTNLTAALAQMQTNAPATNAVSRAPVKAPSVTTYVTGLFASKAERAKLAQARKQAKEDAERFERNPALAAVPPSILEDLLVTRAEVQEEEFRQLRIDRARFVQEALTTTGALTADRLFLLEPKAATDGSAAKGEARVVMTVN